LQKIMRRISFFTYNIPTPTNIKICLEIGWMRSIRKLKIEFPLEFLFFDGWYENVGITLFLTKLTFQKKMQIIRMATHWIHLWAFLLSEVQHKLMDIVCNRLLTVA
jgi:hypothetical protein